MTQQELVNIFQRHGHTVRTQRDEVIVRECVFCGNSRWNLECNIHYGLYHCWACDSGGMLGRMLNDLFRLNIYLPVQFDHRRERKTTTPVTTDGFQSALAVESAWIYLQRRGLVERDVVIHQIGVSTQKDHPFFGRIIFPILDYWSQKAVGYIARTYTGKTPKYLTDIEEKVVVGYRYKTRGIHVVVEGVFDGIASYNAGFNTAVLLGTSNPDSLAWASRVPKEDPIVVMLDGEATKEGNRLYWQIKPVHDRIHLTYLPKGSDPADFEPEVLLTLIQNATL